MNVQDATTRSADCDRHSVPYGRRRRKEGWVYGFKGAYGEGWYQEFIKYVGTYKRKVVANNRFGRSDTSVTGQVLKIMAATPDAVLIVGSGTPTALPQVSLKERSYAGAFC